MTIENEILKLQSNLADSYAACNDKGANIPANQNFDNLADCIDSIQTGGSSFIGIQREVSSSGLYRKPVSSFTFSVPNNATELDNQALYYAFSNCRGVTSVDLSSITTISGGEAMRYAFYSCTNLTSVDLSNLTTISGANAMRNAFTQCTKLTSVDLSSLTNLRISFSMREAFTQCSNLQSLSFPSLKSTSFGSYTNHFYNMLSRVTGCTVHFPSNLQSVIGSWSDVMLGFGGTNTIVLFDLPATT